MLKKRLNTYCRTRTKKTTYGELTLRRLSTQQQQEEISKGQLKSRFSEFGWTSDFLSTDLGEDVQVHIYSEGIAEGVTFYIQLKSITNLEERRKGNFLIYDGIFVKDLKHWEGFALPVILVVWDVNLREGRWEFMENLVTTLDTSRPEWRDKKKVRVKISWVNTTDDQGLQQLKSGIGRKLHPIIFNNEQVKADIKISIPSEDKQAQSQLRQFIEEGSLVEIPGKYVTDVAFSKKYTRWHGTMDPTRIVSLGFKSIPSDSNIRARLVVQSASGFMSYPGIEFRLIQAGLSVMHFSNEHQVHIPLHMRMVVTRDGTPNELELSFQVHFNNLPVEDIHRTFKMLSLFTGDKEQEAKMILESEEMSPLEIPLNQLKIDHSFTEPNERLFHDLSKLQVFLGQELIVPNDGISEQDTEIIYDLIRFFEQGKIVEASHEVTISFKKAIVKRAMVQLKGKRETISFEYQGTSAKLLGQWFKLGNMRKEITGIIGKTIKKSKGQYETIFTDCTIVKRLI